MTRAARPWEAPGYRFSIGWPSGYVCVAADQLIAENTHGKTEISRNARAKAMQSGTGWACGTMTPLSAKSDPARQPGLTRAPMQRAEAQRRGLLRYFTGLPCFAGHVDERYTSSGGCVKCIDIAKAAKRAAAPVRAPRENEEAHFQGKPCKAGHPGLRYRASGSCVECTFLWVKKSREKARQRAIA